jgi:hypothetical protein
MHEHEPTTTSDPRQAAEPYEPKDSRRNQRERILHMLLDASGGWVSAQDLCSASCQYSSRIFELRHHRPHWDIENRVTVVDGKKHGFFRIRRFASVEDGALVSTPTNTTPPAQRPSDREDERPMLLFDGLAPVHRDDG